MIRSGERGFDSVALGQTFREKSLRLDKQQILISEIPESDVAGSSVARINCQGFGMVRKSVTHRSDDWPDINILPQLVPQKLGIPIEHAATTQIFRDAACNFRCWYCFVDFRFLKADQNRSRFFTTDELIELYLKEPNPSKIIYLTGGQPDLLPEWTFWMMRSLERMNLQDRVFLWQDDNLSTEFLWEKLSREQIDYMRSYRNYARATCIKGISAQTFSENTGADPKFFDLQLKILGGLVKEGFDVYTYLTLLSTSVTTAQYDIPILIERLQREVHPNMPLRIFPSKVVDFPETTRRMNGVHISMMQHQYILLDIWREEMAKRYTINELTLPMSQVSLQ